MYFGFKNKQKTSDQVRLIFLYVQLLHSARSETFFFFLAALSGVFCN